LAKWRIHKKSSTWTNYGEIEQEGIFMMTKFSTLFDEFDRKYSWLKKKNLAVLRSREAIFL